MDTDHQALDSGASVRQLHPEAIGIIHLACEQAHEASRLHYTEPAAQRATTSEISTAGHYSYPPRCLLLLSKDEGVTLGRGCLVGQDGAREGSPFGPDDDGVPPSLIGAEKLPGASGDSKKKRQRRNVRVHNNTLFETSPIPADLDRANQDDDKALHRLFNQLIQVSIIILYSTLNAPTYSYVLLVCSDCRMCKERYPPLHLAPVNSHLTNELKRTFTVENRLIGVTFGSREGYRYVIDCDTDLVYRIVSL